MNLLNELGNFSEEIKCEAMPSNSSLFRNELNKFYNTEARMLYSFFHISLKIKPARFTKAASSQTTDQPTAWRGRKEHKPTLKSRFWHFAIYVYLLYTCADIHLIQPIFLLENTKSCIRLLARYFCRITILHILPISLHKTLPDGELYLTANST